MVPMAVPPTDITWVPPALTVVAADQAAAGDVLLADGVAVPRTTVPLTTPPDDTPGRRR